MTAHFILISVLLCEKAFSSGNVSSKKFISYLDALTRGLQSYINSQCPGDLVDFLCHSFGQVVPVLDGLVDALGHGGLVRLTPVPQDLDEDLHGTDENGCQRLDLVQVMVPVDLVISTTSTLKG